MNSVEIKSALALAMLKCHHHPNYGVEWAIILSVDITL